MRANAMAMSKFSLNFVSFRTAYRLYLYFKLVSRDYYIVQSKAFFICSFVILGHQIEVNNKNNVH